MTPPPDAYASIRRAVLDAVEEAKLDPRSDTGAVRALVVRRSSPTSGLPTPGRSSPAAWPCRTPPPWWCGVTQRSATSDPCRRSSDAPDVEEIFIEGDRVLYLDQGGRLRGLAAPDHRGREPSGDRPALSQNPTPPRRQRSPPCSPVCCRGSPPLRCDPAGGRPALGDPPQVHPPQGDPPLPAWERGSLSSAAASFLWAVMQSRRSLIVSGPPGAGKTSLLSALIAASLPITASGAPRDPGAVGAHHPRFVLRGTPPALDAAARSRSGTGEVPARMRPDLIVVGEGPGGRGLRTDPGDQRRVRLLCTVHANSAPTPSPPSSTRRSWPARTSASPSSAGSSRLPSTSSCTWTRRRQPPRPDEEARAGDGGGWPSCPP